MLILRQATATQRLPLGPFVDSTDGNTAEDGLTIANSDIKLWLPGGASLVNKNAGGATLMASGIYFATFDAVDSATVGCGVMFIRMAGALVVRHEFEVLPANVYDARYGTDLQRVDVAQFGNTDGVFAAGLPDVNAAKVGGTVWNAGAIVPGAFADDALTGAAVAASAVTKIQAGMLLQVVEGDTDVLECLRLYNAVLGGKVSGAGTSTEVFRDLADTKNRLTATVDGNGNRTNISRDLS